MNERRNFLSGLSIEETRDEKHETVVPPSSPCSEFDFEGKFETIPNTIPELDDLKLPVVRDKGVKTCIEELSEFFGCHDYQRNYVQFWLLDLIVDCLWLCQDKYEYLEDQTKLVLGWLLFMINLIQDPTRNLTRSEFLQLFRETILTAAELIDEGGDNVPLPLHLVSLVPASGETTPDTEDSKSQESCFQFMYGEEECSVPVRKESCHCSTILSQISESASTVTSKSTYGTLSYCPEEQSRTSLESIKALYKADPNTPPRFISSNSSAEKLNKKKLKSVISIETLSSQEGTTFLHDLGMELDRLYKTYSHTIIEMDQNASQKVSNYLVFRKRSESEMSIPKSKPPPPKLSEMSMMRRLTQYKILEQRLKDLNDSTAGLDSWQLTRRSTINSRHSMGGEPDIAMAAAQMVESDEKKIYGFGMLCFLVDLINDYFGTDFQFTLIKMALSCPPNLIVQVIQDELQYPKDLKDDVTTFVKDLKDKYKEPAEKKVKEAPEKEKKEKPEKEKKEKPKKEPQMSRAEKRELELQQKEELKRQKLLEAELEAERQRAEDNKKYLFTLQEAVDVEFFKTKFENWKVVDISKVLKKKQK